MPCLAAIHLCRVRATRLDPITLAPLTGGTDAYVTDKPMVLTVTPVIEAGADRTLVGGCDCLIAEYRGYDKLKRFDFEFDMGALEPQLLELLTGATLVGSGDGLWFSEQSFDCNTSSQPPVGFEGWTSAWNESSQDPTTPYIHWVWPLTYWQIGAMTLQNDFAQPRVTGFSRGSTQFGNPYGDLSESPGALGGFVYSATLPVGACAYGDGST